MTTKKTPLAIAVNRALSSVAIATTAAMVPAIGHAQEAIEEIVVTGSRLAIDANLESASPVTTVRSDEFAFRGITRVEDLMNRLPQVTPELTANESNGATGTATLDLRGLGSGRTLVLTNGARMGFGNPFVLSPDINQVPVGLIDRVEVLTGGASSTYGSDAMAGVVNFIMKRDFEGVQIDYQTSGYQHRNSNSAVRSELEASGFDAPSRSVSEGGNYSINMLLGVNTADNAGNITAYMGYRKFRAIYQADRDFSACALDSDDGVTCGGSATIPTGLFTPFDGVNYFTVDGNEFVPWDFTFYNYGPLNHFQRPDERYTAGLFAHQEISPRVEAYTAVQFMDDRSLAQIAPSGAFFVNDFLNCSNPLMSAQQLGVLGCTSPDDVVPWYVGRRNVEGGPRFDDLRHTTYRLLAGFRGDISPAWSYDISGAINRTLYSETYNNDMSITRLVRALDVIEDPGTGAPVCRSVVNGVDPNCVPYNVFQTGGVTQAAIDYLTLPLFSKAEMKADGMVAFLTGDLGEYGWTVPAARDGIRVAIGGEYRGEQMDFEPDQGFTSGDGAGQGGPIPAVKGGLHVKELFTEMRIPLVQDRPGIQSLSLDLRYRYSDYSTGVTADTYNIGGEWTPNDAVMFRGGFSRAVRAANINELFQPQSLGLWGGVDPCAGATPELPLAACQNTGVTAGQYGSIPLSPAGQYNAIFGGNPELDPEKGDTFTIGAVFSLDNIVSGLTFSIDYWNIEIKEAISAVDPEFIIRQCAATGDAALCDLINRGPNGNLWIGQASVTSTDVNIGFFETSGIDLVGTYVTDIGLGSLEFSLRGTYLDKFDQQEIPGAEVVKCAGKWGSSCGRPRPEWKHNFTTSWRTPWDLTLIGNWRHVGSVKELSVSPDAYDAGSRNYLDVSGIYSPQWAFGDTTLIVGVNNVLDKDPPVNGRFGNVAVFGNGNTIPGTWDALGRYWFVGVTHHF